MSYEVRVWCEDGTLLGVATVEDTEFVVDEVSPDSGYDWGPYEFSSPAVAEEYARQWAESYVDCLQRTCDCGESDCGAIHPHGISIQYCRDGYTVDELG